MGTEDPGGLWTMKHEKGRCESRTNQSGALHVGETELVALETDQLLSLAGGPHLLFLPGQTKLLSKLFKMWPQPSV